MRQKIAGAATYVYSRSKYLVAMLFFAGLSGALFRQALLKHLSLVPAQIGYMIDNLHGAEAAGILAKYPNNSLLFDVAFQFFPWSSHSLTSIHNWTIPLWNPYSLAGLPFLANHQSSVFELTKLLGYSLGLSAVWLPSLSWWLTIALAGFFTFAFLRELDLSFPAAVIGGSAFALSGPMIVWLGWPHSSTALWLPFLLLCVDKIIKNKGLHWIAWLAIGVAFVFYAGHIQIGFFVVFATGAWTIFRLFTITALVKADSPDGRSWIDRVKLPIAGLAAGGLLGLGLASIQLGPMVEFVRQSSLSSGGRSFTGGMGLWEALRTGFLFRPHGFSGFRDAFANLGLFVYPDLFGNTNMAYFRLGSNYNEGSVYIGILAFTLVPAALFNRRHRRTAIFWLVLAVVCWGGALAIPGLAAINYLPLFNMTNMGRIRYIVAFALAILAAIGFDTVFGESEKQKRQLRMLIFVLLLTWLAGAAFLAVGFSARLGNQIPSKEMLIGEGKFLVELLAGAVLAALLFWRDNRYSQQAARVLLILLVAFELVHYGSPVRGNIDPSLALPKSPALNWLRKHAHYDRVTSFHLKADNRTSLYPNTSVLLRLQDIRGYEVINVLRFERLQGVVAGTDSRTNYREFNRDFFDIAGVKYFIQSTSDPERRELESRGFTAVYKDRGTVIYRNNTVLPRAFIAYRTRSVDSVDEAIDALSKGKVDFQDTAIVEEGPALKGRRTLTKAAITRYRPESIDITVKAAEPGLLVLSDAYYPDWTAFVDGRSTAIYPANVAFRGIVVPKGKHLVRFVYRPASYSRALYVFFPSLIIIFGLFGLAIVKKRKDKPWKSA